MKVKTEITYSVALKDTTSAEYKSAAAKVTDLFGGNIRALAARRGLRVRSITVSFNPTRSRRSTVSTTGTEAVIDTVYETLDAADGSANDFKVGIIDAFVEAAELAITTGSGKLVPRDTVPTVEAAIEEKEVPIADGELTNIFNTFVCS